MQKDLNIRMLISPFMVGVALGIIAKFADGRKILYYFPILADIMGRFGIWVWAAALIAVRSKTPLLAAARSPAFFAGMLMAYYGYTVLFLGFFPKSQVILWGIVAMVTPFCGFMIWHVHKKKHYTNVIASLPFILFFTEWYLTVFAERYLTVEEKLLLLIVYIGMTFSLLAAIPAKKRLFGLLYGLVLSALLIWLVQAGTAVNLYEQMLNV